MINAPTNPLACKGEHAKTQQKLSQKVTSCGMCGKPVCILHSWRGADECARVCESCLEINRPAAEAYLQLGSFAPRRI